MAKERLDEMTASEQAHALGLEYCGFGGWCDSNRVAVAKTVDGKLVRVGPGEEEGNDKDLGRLIIVDFDDNLLYSDLDTNTTAQKFVHFLQAVIKSGSNFIVLHSRNVEKKVAKFLLKIGITAGVRLLPYGSSDAHKKRELVEKKIKAGYSEIRFFDRDEKSCHAVEGLKAPYNKRQIKLDVHQIPPVEPDNDSKRTTAADSEGQV
jgi:hypothetical protein